MELHKARLGLTAGLSDSEPLQLAALTVPSLHSTTLVTPKVQAGLQ